MDGIPLSSVANVGLDSLRGVSGIPESRLSTKPFMEMTDPSKALMAAGKLLNIFGASTMKPRSLRVRMAAHDPARGGMATFRLLLPSSHHMSPILGTRPHTTFHT